MSTLKRIWRILQGRKNWDWTYDEPHPADARIVNYDWSQLPPRKVVRDGQFVSPEAEDESPANEPFSGDGGN